MREDFKQDVARMARVRNIIQLVDKALGDSVRPGVTGEEVYARGELLAEQLEDVLAAEYADGVLETLTLLNITPEAFALQLEAEMILRGEGWSGI